MRLIWILMAVFLVMMIVGCTGLSLEQTSALDRLGEKLEVVVGESRAVAERLVGIFEKQKDIREKLAAGTLSSADAAETLSGLAEDAGKLMAHYENLQSQKTDLSAELTNLQDAGVPWWHIVGYSALTLVSGYLGFRNFNLVDGLKLLITSVEKAPDKVSIKKRVEKHNNPIVNRMVEKLT